MKVFFFAFKMQPEFPLCNHGRSLIYFKNFTGYRFIDQENLKIVVGRVPVKNFGVLIMC